MISHKGRFFLGIFIFITPFLGFPSFWKTTFIVVAGLTLIFSSINIPAPRKNTKQRVKKERVTPVFVESVPVYPKDNTIETMGNVTKPSRRKSEQKTDIK